MGQFDNCLSGARALPQTAESGARILPRAIERMLSIEEFGVRTCARQFKDENIFVNVVDQKPIGRNMAFAMMRLVVRKRMIVH